MSWTGPAEIVLYLAAGAALGAVYFLLLLRTARLHASRAVAVRIVPLYIMRFAAAGAVFWVVARQGAPALLLALLGFLIARLIIQRFVVSE